MNTEAINSKECGGNLYQVNVWNGAGYLVTPFLAYACHEEEALEYVLAYCQKCDFVDMFETADYLSDKLDLTDEEIDEMYIYVDPTMTDRRAFPAYFRTENLYIEKVA